MTAIEELREIEFDNKMGREGGKEDISEFIAALDGDRIRLVSRLKVVFDRVDGDDDGEISFFEFKGALNELNQQNAMNSDAKIVDWLKNAEDAGKSFDFPEFASTYTALFANHDPDVRCGDGKVAADAREAAANAGTHCRCLCCFSLENSHRCFETLRQFIFLWLQYNTHHALVFCSACF
jgi:hypothetical protein